MIVATGVSHTGRRAQVRLWEQKTEVTSAILNYDSTPKIQSPGQSLKQITICLLVRVQPER